MGEYRDGGPLTFGDAGTIPLHHGQHNTTWVYLGAPLVEFDLTSYEGLEHSFNTGHSVYICITLGPTFAEFAGWGTPVLYRKETP